MAVKPEDLGIKGLTESLSRIKQIENELLCAQRKIALNRGQELETNERRLKAELREKDLQDLENNQESFLIVTPGFGQEAYIGERNNILSGEFLEIGIMAARAVCKITRGVETGTGFLVGEGIVLTNYHVISSPTEAESSIFEFLYDDNTIGTARNVVSYAADPDKFFYGLEELDLCFVALREVDGFPKLKTFGWLPLLRDEGKILIGDPVNIVQHPRGQQKRLVVHDSTFVLVTEESEANAFCWYSGDTDKGSSGSPVMNARWEVVALHHKAIPAVDKNGHVLDVDGKMIAESRIGDADTRVKWIANEGVRVSRIVANLEAASFVTPQKEIRDSLLALWSDPIATMLARLASFNGMNNQ